MKLIEIASALNHAAEMIGKNCRPWIQATRDLEAYRWIDNGETTSTDGIGYATLSFCDKNVLMYDVPKKRRPRDLPNWLHDAVGKWMTSEFGHNYRENAVFCSGKTFKTGKEYGKPYRFYAAGEFSYLASYDVEDLYEVYELSRQGVSGGDWQEKVTDIVLRRLNKAAWLHNEQLQAMLKDEAPPEIMVSCERYYVVRTDWSQLDEFTEQVRAVAGDQSTGQ